MMSEVGKLMTYGTGAARGIGCIEPAAVEAAHGFLLKHGQLGKPVDPGRACTTRFWQAAQK